MTVTEVEPSAPPTANDDAAIPTVTATTVETDTAFVPTASAVVAEDGTTPAKECPPGMKMQTTTTTYPDGRKVTTTEFVPEGNVAASAAPATAAPATAAAAPAASAHHPPRRDLGSTQATVTCPYCNHNGVTKTNQQCGECTWISVIVLLLFCFPFAWIPLVCPSCADTEHFCRNCGKQVGLSKADCCNN